MAMMTVRMFTNWLGMTESDVACCFRTTSHAEKTIYGHDAYVEYKDLGICFVYLDEPLVLGNRANGVHGTFRLSTVHFIPEGRETGYSGYQGVLLPGVAFGDRRESVHTTIGHPSYSQASTLPAVEGIERSVILDRYDFGAYYISFEYSAEDGRLNLLSLSLSPDKKVDAA